MQTDAPLSKTVYATFAGPIDQQSLQRLFQHFAALAVLGMIVAGYLCISSALAACCQIDEINEEPTKADLFLIDKYFGKPAVETTEFKVKHIRSLTLICEKRVMLIRKFTHGTCG